jgi:hypothetical protein
MDITAIVLSISAFVLTEAAIHRRNSFNEGPEGKASQIALAYVYLFRQSGHVSQ